MPLEGSLLKRIARTLRHQIRQAQLVVVDPAHPRALYFHPWAAQYQRTRPLPEVHTWREVWCA